MKKTLAALAAVTGILLLGACGAEQQPVAAPDEPGYKTALLQDGAIRPSETEAALNIGYKICGYKEQGASDARIMVELTGVGSLDEETASEFLSAATTHLCGASDA